MKGERNMDHSVKGSLAHKKYNLFLWKLCNAEKKGDDPILKLKL